MSYAKLSLVIPCFNEAENLPLLLDKCSTLCAVDGIEIILVNNGSTDNSAQILEALLPRYPSCRVIHVPENRGYGFGVLSGLNAADGDILAWTHADLQTDPNDILRGVEIFKMHGDGVYVKGRRIGRPIADNFFTIGMSIFETCLLGMRLWDINAQPNIFSRNFFESWNNPPYDFSLDLYVYFTARQQGLSVCRFPVNFGERAYGISNWNINWTSKVKFIRRTVEYSFDLKKRLSA